MHCIKLESDLSARFSKPDNLLRNFQTYAFAQSATSGIIVCLCHALLLYNSFPKKSRVFFKFFKFFLVIILHWLIFNQKRGKNHQFSPHFYVFCIYYKPLYLKSLLNLLLIHSAYFIKFTVSASTKIAVIMRINFYLALHYPLCRFPCFSLSIIYSSLHILSGQKA